MGACGKFRRASIFVLARFTDVNIIGAVEDLHDSREEVAVSEPELPDAELEVLASLWRGGAATVRQVREAMQEYRPMSHASAFTLLRRLEAKGLVRREKAPAGKAFVFRPTTRPGRTYRRVVKDLLDRVFGGSPVTMVSSLFETRPPTKEELDELQALLDGLRRKGTKKGGGS